MLSQLYKNYVKMDRFVVTYNYECIASTRGSPRTLIDTNNSNLSHTVGCVYVCICVSNAHDISFCAGSFVRCLSTSTSLYYMTNIQHS